MRLLSPRQSTFQRAGARRARAILVAASLGAVLCGMMAGIQPVLLVVPLLIAVPIVLWKHPEFGVIFLIATATVIENLTFSIGSHSSPFTSKIPWWRTFTHGMILFPVEFFLILLLLVWVLKAGEERSFGLPKSPIFTALKVFWIFLIIAVGLGLARGAQLKFDLWEVRSWIYLTVVILLAAALIKTKAALWAVLWTFVLGSGFKGIQGTIIFFSYARKMDPRPEYILAHEEAFFFGVFIAITAALWLYGIKGRLRTTATALLPFVVIADLANARRTAWAILAMALLTMAVIGLVTLPNRRKFLRRTLILAAVVSTVYFPVYWHKDGTLAQPARAVQSQFHPSQRDEASDLYRQQENANLILDIRNSGLLGLGFGRPIGYELPITNISNYDPMIAFIPHDGILWIWLKTGMQGEIAFWCLIGIAIVRSCDVARASDRKLAMFGNLVACSIVGYLVYGYEDLGFAEFRIAVGIGCLSGAMEAARRMASDGSPDSPDGLQAPLPAIGDERNPRWLHSARSTPRPSYRGAISSH
jgi:hypothetical protein